MFKKRLFLLLAIIPLLMVVGCNKDSGNDLGNQINDSQEQATPENNDVLENEENEDNNTGDNASTEESGMKSTDHVTLLNDINSTSLDDYDENKWRKLSQGGGIDTRIYYGDQQLLMSEKGSTGPGTYKYDLEAKEEIWQESRIRYSGSSHLRLDNGILYVAKSDEILGLDHETGKTEYQYELPDFDLVDEVRIFDDYVLVGVGEDLILFDRSTEEMLWNIPYQIIRREINTEHNIFLVDDTLILPYRGEKVMGIEAQTGEEKWTIDAPHMEGSSFAANEEAIYLFNGSHKTEGGTWSSTIEKYDIASQEKIEEAIYSDSITPRGYRAVATEDHVIFIKFGSDVQTITAINQELSQELWEVRGDNYTIQDIIYDNGKVYALADDKDQGEYLFIIIDSSTGEVEEKIILEDGQNDDPNLFYTYDGKVYVLLTMIGHFYYIFDEEDVHRPFPK